MDSRSVSERPVLPRLLLASVVESSQDAIITVSPELVLTSWNEAAARLFGYSTEEALGRPNSLLWPQDRIDEETRISERILRGERIPTYDSQRLRKDGSTIDVSVTISPLREPGGKVLGVSKIMRDISDRKRAEEALRESEDRYRTLFDLNTAAVYSCDTSGLIQKFNPRAAELWGRAPRLGDTQERYCGSHKMIRPDGTPMPHDQCPMAGVVNGTLPEVRDAEVVIERPDGTRITVVVNIRPLKNRRGEITGAINCFYDITGRKDMEEALRAALEARETFTSMASHELRTPLTTLQLQLQCAIRSLRKEDLAPDARERLLGMIEKAERHGNRIARLIGELLDVSRIGAGKLALHLKEVDLSSLVREVIEHFKEDMDQKGSTLECSIPGPILGQWDGFRLEQVVVNLLSNAVKFGIRRPIRVMVEAEADRATIRVEDQGIGIAPEFLNRLFQPYQQGGPPGEHGGLGIGLYIASQIVEAHGGSIRVKSAPDQGSTFTVELPRRLGTGS